jgi:hypothetical protein
VEVKLHTFFTSAVDRGGHFHFHATLSPQKAGNILTKWATVNFSRPVLTVVSTLWFGFR